jgi:hypothetical protein
MYMAERTPTGTGLSGVVMVLVLMISHGFRTIAYVTIVGFAVFAVLRWGSAELQAWVAARLLLLVAIWRTAVGKPATPRPRPA